jgi:hypothetical protein
MRYPITDVARSIVEVGQHHGHLAAFVHFSRCSRWGEARATRPDPEESMPCAAYCDAVMHGGRVVGPEELVAAAARMLGSGRLVVLTGGEPLESVDRELLEAFWDAGWGVVIETSGCTAPDPALLASPGGGRLELVVSPKKRPDGTPEPILVPRADALVVVLPGDGWPAEDLDTLASTWPEARLYLRPEDPPAPGLVGVSALLRDASHDEDEAAVLDRRFIRNLESCLRAASRDPRWAVCLPANKLVIGRAI